MDAPTHIHGWHRKSRRSHDQRRTRRQLRVCPAVTRRHLDRFIWLYEDTVWVKDADIERETSVDPGANEEEQLTGQDELWAVERRDATTQEVAIIDTVASTSTSAGLSIRTDTTTTPFISTSTGAGTTTQPKSDLLAKTDMSVHLALDKDPTAHDEIKAIMMERRNVTTQENGNTDGTPSTSTAAGASTMNQTKAEAAGELVPAKYSPGLSSSLDWFLNNKERIGDTNAPGGSSGVVLAEAGTTSQPKPEATGEVVQTEYSSELFSSLDWFFKNKERIGSMDAPGGSSGGVCRHGNVE